MTRFPMIEWARRHALSLSVALLPALPVAWPADAGAQEVKFMVQRSPLAGFRYHEAPRLLPQLRPGEPLSLLREPGNPHDRNAVRVEWQGHKLGYVPRRQNEALAWAMDTGQSVSARIVEPPRRRGRRRVDFEVYVE